MGTQQVLEEFQEKKPLLREMADIPQKEWKIKKEHQIVKDKCIHQEILSQEVLDQYAHGSQKEDATPNSAFTTIPNRKINVQKVIIIITLADQKQLQLMITNPITKNQMKDTTKHANILSNNDADLVKIAITTIQMNSD